MNHQERSHKRPLIAALLLLACCLGAALCAPRNRISAKRLSTDPLLAIPSDDEYIQATPVSQPQQQEQTEVYQQHQQPADHPTVTEVRQGVYYVPTHGSYQQSSPLLSQQHYPELQEQPDQQQNNQRQQQQEYVQQQQQVEYPGQIVYVGQNGEISRIIQDSQSPRQAHEQLSQNIGDMVLPSSALPATILTEVPLKDLSGDVLDKLRRDYGVKVVATRDRPGANLIINCDDSTGQEQTSICAKSYRNNNNNASPYAFEAGAGVIEEQLSQVEPIYTGPRSKSYFFRGSMEAAMPEKVGPTLEVTTIGQDIQKQYAAYIHQHPTVSVNPEVLDKTHYDEESSQQGRQQVIQHQQQMTATNPKEVENNQTPTEAEQHQYAGDQSN